MIGIVIAPRLVVVIYTFKDYFIPYRLSFIYEFTSIKSYFVITGKALGTRSLFIIVLLF